MAGCCGFSGKEKTAEMAVIRNAYTYESLIRASTSYKACIATCIKRNERKAHDKGTKILFVASPHVFCFPLCRFCIYLALGTRVRAWGAGVA